MTQRVPSYPNWKKIAWRFARAFVSGFLTSLAVSIKVVEVSDLNQALLISLLVGAATAGLQAAGKALREWLAEGNYQSLLHKLPF